MNILWYSTAPWSPSSYSVLTARTVPNIARAGHIVSVGTWYGLQGQPLPWSIKDYDGVPVMVYPSGDGPNFSQDVLVPLYRYTQSDILITVSDVWPFDPRITDQTIFCPWLPIDMDPAPKVVVDAVKSAVYPMVMSSWGTQVLKDSGIDCAFVPASAPSKLFKPGPKDKAREMLGFPKDAFIIGAVAANKDPADRKGLRVMLQAFAKFREKYPNSYLYLHTNFGGSVPIGEVLELLKLTSEDDQSVIAPDPMAYRLGLLDQTYMVNVYQSIDVLLNLPLSEGFGLPLLEAQMCGCPVIATDFSTTDEMLWAGWKVQGQKDIAVGLNSFRMYVDVNNAIYAIEDAYHQRDNETMRNDARKGALSLDTDRVYRKYWKPALAEMQQLVDKNKEVAAVPA